MLQKARQSELRLLEQRRLGERHGGRGLRMQEEEEEVAAEAVTAMSRLEAEGLHEGRR